MTSTEVVLNKFIVEEKELPKVKLESELNQIVNNPNNLIVERTIWEARERYLDQKYERLLAQWNANNSYMNEKQVAVTKYLNSIIGKILTEDDIKYIKYLKSI